MKFPQILARIFPPARSEKSEADLEAERRLTLVLLGIVLLALAAILLFNLVVDPRNRGVLIVASILTAITLVLAYFNILLPGRVLMLLTIFAAVTSIAMRGGIRDEAIIAYAAMLVLAGLLLGQSGALIFGLLTVLAIIYIGYQESAGRLISNLEPVTLQDTFTQAIIFLAVALFLYVLIGRMNSALRRSRQSEQAQAAANRELTALKEELEIQANRSREQLRAVIEIGRAANASLNQEELIEHIVNLITERFGYYYAGLFLIDQSGQWAELRSATGAAGKIMLQNRHRLEVSGQSMVGAAISTREARVALDVGKEAVRFNNPLLPETRSEIALPLIVGDRVLGALDVQSTEEAAFGPQEIETLQGMASQVAIGLENARLYQEAQQNLNELNSVYRQYLSSSWSQIEKRKGIKVDVGMAETEQSGQSISIPLALRETPIGNIVIESEGELSPEEISVIEAVAAQAALALENARLLEETQQTAIQEHTTADITSKVWSAVTIDAILQTAIKELGQALNATKGIIELKLE
jgi:GAF domain-containing protein